jgi:heme exporter protein B
MSKDLALELRSREILNSMLVFVLLVVVVFSFVFEPGQHDMQGIAGGVYWMALSFAGILGLGKTMQSEISGDNLSALLLTLAGRNSIFAGKVASIFLFLLAVQAVMLVLFAVLYEVNLMAGFSVIVLIFAATYGFALLGTLVSLIAARTRTREIMLPILLLPLLVPVLIAAVQATNLAVDGAPLSGYIKWIRLIFVYDIVFSAISLLLFAPLVEE